MTTRTVNLTGAKLPGGLELITKLGTVSVVALYALGLLVTNIHLMGLGIADFSALQARFVLSGLLFLLYTVLLLGLPAALVFGLWAANKWVLKDLPRLGRFIVIVLIVLPLWTWLVLSFYGSILSYLYPWGSSYESMWAGAFSLRASFAKTPQLLKLVKDAFLQIKTVAGVVLAYLLLAQLVMALKTNLGPVFVSSLIIILGVISTTLILFGYAQRVFPNLPYNLGGGQPRIIQVHVRSTDPLLLSTSGLAMDDKTGGPLVSVPLALWHQDSTFMYVTPASSQYAGAARLTAITTQAIEAVEYLSGYVKVTSGSRIEDAYVDSFEGPP